MLNFECVDKKDGLVELCFTDEAGDEAVKIIVSEDTAWDIVRGIRKKFNYLAKLKSGE